MESVLGSQASLLAAHGARVAMGVAATWAIVRGLDRTELGEFVMVSTMAVLTAQVVDAGMTPALTAELARGDGGTAFFRRILRWRARLAAVMALTGVCWLATRQADIGLPGLVALVAIAASLPARTWNATFNATRRFRIPALFGVVAQMVFVVAVFLGFGVGHALVACLSGLALREMLVGLLPWWRSRRLFESLPVEVSQAEPPRHLFSLALATACSAAFFPVDVFVLEAHRDSGVVGDFGVAVRVVLPVMAAVPLLCAPLLPLFADADREDGLPLGTVLWGVASALGAGVPVALALGLGDDIVALLAGEARPVAGAALNALAPIPALMVFGSVGSLALIATRRYRAWCVITLAALVLNVVLALAWVDQHGAVGVARATVVAEIFIGVGAMVMLALALRRGPVVAALLDVLAALVPAALAFGVYRVVSPDSASTRLFWGAFLAVVASLTFLLSPLAKRIRARMAMEEAV